MDLQQEYDRINTEALWQVLLIYGVNGKLLNGIKSIYDDSKACVRIYRAGSDCFNINSGVRQGCAMSSWLFNLYMDGVMKELEVGWQGMVLESWLWSCFKIFRLRLRLRLHPLQNYRLRLRLH